MRPKRQWDLLLDPVCKYCKRRFIENIPRYKSHLRNHELSIKPYWYDNPTLKPKAGCLELHIKRLQKRTCKDQNISKVVPGHLKAKKDKKLMQLS